MPYPTPNLANTEITIVNLYNKQLEVFKKWLQQVAPQIDANFSLKLWNGEVIPLGNNASSDVVAVIYSSEVLTRLIYRPRLATVFALYYENLIGVEGGTPLDMMRQWDHMSVVRLARSMSKIDFIKSFWPFLFKSSKPGANESLSYTGKIEDKFSTGRDDKELIQFHYDVSNKFYSLFLDPNMVYSCGYFKTPETSLEQAQIDKLDIICRKLRLQPGERFLDIGCGWGGLVCHAAQHYGVQAHGVTLSQAQYDFAQEKIKRLGLEDRVTVELRDYRTIEGSACYDKIVQVGMFEHVGFENHDQHFKHVNNLLRPRGLYLHHAITQRVTPNVEDYRKPSPYMKVVSEYIFPGSQLDYIGLTVTNLERHGFEVHDVENLREHYQMTLEHWISNLWDNRDEADEAAGWRKTRAWLLAFSMFAFFFERGGMYIYQTLSSRRRVGPSHLPLTRDDLYR